MSKKIYGNLINRINEGKNYNDDHQIHEGDDITMYSYTDRNCYYVTKVVDQKHIFVKRYQICADYDLANGMGHQNWKYFKTIKDENEYMNKYFPDNDYSNYEVEEEEWVFRNNSWKSVERYSKEIVDQIKQRDGFCWFECRNDKEQKKFDEGGEILRYSKLEPISFGVRDYYYDWGF